MIDVGSEVQGKITIKDIDFKEGVIIDIEIAKEGKESRETTLSTKGCI